MMLLENQFYALYFLIMFINDISNIFNDNDNIHLNLYADDTSLSIYSNSDYEISENMKLFVGC